MLISDYRLKQALRRFNPQDVITVLEEVLRESKQLASALSRAKANSRQTLDTSKLSLLGDAVDKFLVKNSSSSSDHRRNTLILNTLVGDSDEVVTKLYSLVKEINMMEPTYSIGGSSSP